MPADEQDAWAEVEISEVRRSAADDPATRMHAVVLKELNGDRQLAIYIGRPEAVALACSLESIDTLRPMTYQFAADLATAGGSTVSEVRVTRFSELTFHALVILVSPTGMVEVDARPSDALNLALVAGAPVRVHERLFDDPDMVQYDSWRRYTTGAPELATEVVQRQARQRERIAMASGGHEGD
jgi:bifunctional DNase/RNase